MPFEAGAVYSQMQLDLGPFNAGLQQAFNTIDRTTQNMSGRWTSHSQVVQQELTRISGSLGQAEKAATGFNVGGLGKMITGFALAQLGVTSFITVFSKLTGLIHQGIKEAEDFHQATIRLTAAIQDSHPEIPYARAQAMASSFVETSRGLAAEIGITGEEVAGITRGVQEFGIGVNLSTKQGQADFQALLMSLKTYHAGMDLASSSTRELNAIFNELAAGSGGGGAFTALATRLKEMDPLIKAHVKEWQEVERSTGQTGYTLSKLAGMMAGVNASIEAEKGSFQAVRTVLDETVNHILRDGFTPVVQDIAGILRQINIYLNEHGEQIRGTILGAWENLKVAATGVWTAVQAIYAILSVKIGGESLGKLLLEMALGAAGFVVVVRLVQQIQSISFMMMMGVSPLSVGAAIIALASPAILEGAERLGTLVGGVGAGPATAQSATDLANLKARYAGAKGFTSTGEIAPTGEGGAAGAIIPGAPPEVTPADLKAQAAAAKLAREEARQEMIRTMEANAELITQSGRLLEGEMGHVQANYYKVISAAKVTTQEIVAAQKMAAAQTEKAWMNAWNTAQEGLRQYQAANAATMNEIAGYERELAQLRGEERGQSKADTLRDEGQAIQKVRDDEKITIEERIRAGSEEVAIERERLAAAKAAGAGVVEAEQALAAARQTQITLLEQGTAKARQRAQEEVAGIEVLKTQISTLQSQYRNTVDFLRANMNLAGNEAYRTWVKELPDSIEQRWSRLNLKKYLVLGGEAGGGPSIGGAPNTGTIIAGDVHITIPGTGMSLPEITNAVQAGIARVANSRPQPEGAP